MRLRTAIFVLAACAASTAYALAWGGKGHTIVSHVGAQMIAKQHQLPAFLTSPSAVFEIGYLGPEEDRLKGSGTAWDADNDPGHFLDVRDDGTIAGVVRLSDMPPSQEAYERALETANTDEYRQGYLPYSLLDGWEQLRMDFAYWRVDKGPVRALDQQLILRDIGMWSHFVGDASQPLHVTVHFNGWGHYPNPNRYTQSSRTHEFFESAFVDRVANERAVERLVSAKSALPVPSSLLSQATVMHEIERYLQQTANTVPQLYAIDKRGGFADASPEAVRFVDSRLAAGAQELRDLTLWAWEDSLNESVGHPSKPVREFLHSSAAAAGT